MILVLAALALGAPPDSTSAESGVFPYPVHASVLDNGLQLYVVPMPSPGVVAYYSVVRVGSGDETDAGRTGFAHFFEHLMFKGSESIPEDERAKRLLRLGVDGNAWTWWDETTYHYTLSSEGLPEMVTLEADRFAHLALTPDQVQKEAGAVYGELRKSKASPDYGLTLALWGTAFTVAPYTHDTLGYEADIAAMPTAHTYAKTFFDRYYRPDNVHIVVAGDIDPAAVEALVAKAYGDWPASTEPRPELPVEPEQTETREVSVTWPAPTAARLSLGWKIPAYDPATSATADLALAADLLLSDVGPLKRRLVQEEALAYEVYGGTSDNVQPGLFTVEVVARDPEHLARIEAIVREEVAALVAGVPQATLDAARTHSRYAFLSGLDDPSAVASALSWSLRRAQRADVIDVEWAGKDAVTPESISATVGEWLVDAHLTKATLLPEAR